MKILNKNMDDWKIKIQDRPAQYLTDIFIYRCGFDNKIIIWDFKGKDTVEEKGYDISDSIPATLTIPSSMLSGLLEAIIGKGIKPPEETFLKGKLVRM